MEYFINMTDGIHNHFTVAENPNAISGVDWPSTLSDLIKRACPNGPTPGRLEINAHGHPALISLRPQVTQANVGQFAAMIRQLLQPGGTIEILSCLVSLIPVGMLKTAGLLPADHLTAFTAESRAMMRHRVVEQGPMPKTNFTPAQLVAMAEASIKAPRNLMTQEEFDSNGPLFCSTLANETMCRVRAAMFTQTEEGEQSGNRHYSTPFGNWDGHVFDYLPGRRVQYAGFNVPRATFRTHDEHGDGPLRLA